MVTTIFKENSMEPANREKLENGRLGFKTRCDKDIKRRPCLSKKKGISAKISLSHRRRKRIGKSYSRIWFLIWL